MAPHPANPNFGPQATVSGSVFVGQGSERESETMAYRGIPPSFPRGREVVAAAAQGNVVPATISVHTMSTTTLTSTTMTCTAQGIPATYIMVRGPPYMGATYGQPVAIPVVSQTIDQTGIFQNGWPGTVSQSAAMGNYGGFWG